MEDSNIWIAKGSQLKGKRNSGGKYLQAGEWVEDTLVRVGLAVAATDWLVDEGTDLVAGSCCLRFYGGVLAGHQTDAARHCGRWENT